MRSVPANRWSRLRSALLFVLAAVRQAEGPGPAGLWNAGRYWASKALLSLTLISIFHVPVPVCSSWTGQGQLTCCSAWAGVRMEPIHSGFPRQSAVLLRPGWRWDRWMVSWLESLLPTSWGQASPCATTGARSVPALLWWWCCLLNLAT